MSSVHLDTLGINVNELQQIAGTEEFNDFVENLLDGKSESERVVIMDAIHAELNEAILEYETMLKGAKEDEDRYREMDDEAREARAEEEQDELQDIIDYLEDDAENFITEAENEFLKTHRSTSDDLSLSTSEFENGDVVFVECTSDLATLIPETAEYEKGTDYTNDDVINYADYELFVQDQKKSMYDSHQDIFLRLDPGFTVKDTKFSGDKVVYTVSNGEKTIQYEISNIKEGVHIFFDSTEDGFIPTSTYKGWPAELQKITYFGDSLDSVYEVLHPASDAEKLDYVAGYDETSEAVEGIAAEFTTSNTITVTEKVQEYIDLLFGYYNNLDGDTLDEIWSEIHRDLSSLDEMVQSDILTSLMYTIASENDQTTTVLLFSNQASKIEDVFFKNGLTESEMMSVMFLESFVSPDLGGYYGGGNQFWSSPQLSLGSIGPVFYTNDAGGIEINPESEYAQYFADVDTTIAAMKSFKDSLKFVAWASDNGIVQTTINRLEEMNSEQESGTTDVVRDEDVDKAKDMEDKIDNICTVWTDVDFYKDGLWDLFSLIVKDKSIEQLAAEILSYFRLDKENGGVANHDHRDDIAADFVCLLKEEMPELFKSLCNEDGWASSMKGFIDDDYLEPENMDTALDYLN